MRILYFASVREAVGKHEEDVDPPAAVRTITNLVDWLAAQSPEHAQAFANRTKLRAAIDDRFAGGDDPIAGAREIALFPPVTGG